AVQIPVKDSIFNLAPGGVFGPYLDDNSYVIARKVESRSLPDSVKCRHILLGTANPQTGQPLMPDSVAKAKADSVAAAIRGGANFDTLAARYSTDQAAQQTGGVMTFSSTQIQGENFAPEFGRFILLEGKPGDKQVIKTNFGYHYIEIMEHMNVQPHHKVAYLAKPITASQETEDAASARAASFAGSSTNPKTFQANYDKNLKGQGVNMFPAADLRATDYSIAGLGNSREFVKAIFDADVNDVLQPFRVGDAYVVAAVTEVNKPGLASVRKARPIVEPILKNEKKAARIKQRLGKITTLEAAATAYGQQVQVADSISFVNNTQMGFVPKVTGAIFNAANRGKVVPEALEEVGGVFVVRVENVSATSVPPMDIAQQRQMLQMQYRQQMSQAMMYGQSPLQFLRNAAKIKDNRSRFY
ncbi:MAG TPA: peptidylprolyl isomerase, partial [Chitinophagaceae bacterium]|nr:peptidylprolyl isomerase [Chitinophagaceae bacterium]